MEKEELFDFKFYDWEEQHSDQPFLKQPFGDSWEVYTYGQVGDMARRLATGLKSLGLPPKSHIGLISKNCREWIIADLAILMAGYISVPFFPNLTSKEIKNLVEFGDVKALFAGKLEDWPEIKAGLPTDLPIIAFPHYKGNSKVTDGHQWHDFIHQFEPQKENFKPLLDDTWTVIFTSGTTGSPKGVVLSYRTNDNTKLLIEASNVLQIDFTGKNEFFSYLPLNHIAERVVIEFICLRYGGTISFTESLETFVSNLKETQPTVFFGVPRIYTKFQTGILSKMSQKKLDRLLRIPILSSLIKKKLKKALGLSRARAIVSGAAPMLESQRTWFRQLGIDIINGYGMTENCAVCTQMGAKDTSRVGSVGKAQTKVKLKIDAESGEILMKGPFLMTEYYKNPEATKAALQDGWLHTGDQGRIDDEGYLFITGRVKDTFKTSKGEFIEPLALEVLFGDLAEFEQICVVGLGNPQPMILAVLSEVGAAKQKGTLEAKLSKKIKAVNDTLPNYKKISTMVLVNEGWSTENGILTPTLKIKRSKVHEKYSKKFKAWHESEQDVLWE